MPRLLHSGAATASPLLCRIARARIPLLPPALCLALPLASAAAQWADGDLIVRVISASGPCSYLRVDPVTGSASTLLGNGYPAGFAGSATYDAHRDVMLLNVSLPPDPYWLARVWAVQANGGATPIASIGTGHMRGLCSAGDGRVIYQVHAPSNGEIRWIDDANQTHSLLDATGSAPFLFDVEHLLYHAPSNALLATTSGWWSANDCAPNSSSIFRIPLSLDGTRVGGPVTCVQLATANQEIMNIDFMPGGQVLLCLASGTSPIYPYLLRTVDPVTLAIGNYANPTMGDLDGAVFSPRAGGAIVVDDASNVLRLFTSTSGVGPGTVIPTSMPVSSGTTGYSPAENLWEVDRNGPGCQGAAIAYGAGLSGLGGFVPALRAVGCPDRGAPWSLSIDAAVGGTLGVLGLGEGPASIPLFGGLLLIFPITATTVIATSGAPSTPGVGTVNLPLVLNDPALVGVSLWLQAALLDAAAAQGWSLTNGLQVILG